MRDIPQKLGGIEVHPASTPTRMENTCFFQHANHRDWELREAGKQREHGVPFRKQNVANAHTVRALPCAGCPLGIRDRHICSLAG